MTKLRGIQDDFAITLNGRNWTEMMADLASQLERPRGATWRRGAKVWLEAAGCPPSASELEQMVWLLEMHDVKLEWWKDAEGTGKRKSPSEKADFTRAEKVQPGTGETGSENQGVGVLRQQEPNLWSHAALVSRTLRSGQLIRYAGTVVVFGDVNPGAVIIADGNVIVWGRLRGVVHAGAAGDDEAVVGALQLAPTQLRIGGQIGRAPDANKDAAPGAEIARVRDGRITIEDWDDGKV